VRGARLGSYSLLGRCRKKGKRGGAGLGQGVRGEKREKEIDSPI